MIPFIWNFACLMELALKNLSMDIQMWIISNGVIALTGDI